MRSFHEASLVAGAVVLALLTGCSGANIAGPAVGGADTPAAFGAQTLSGSFPQGTGVAVHPFINFAADEGSSDAFEYAYPAGGTPASTLSIGNGVETPFGTAVIPTRYPSSSR